MASLIDIQEDWNSLSGSEDWNTATPNEDWNTLQLGLFDNYLASSSELSAEPNYFQVNAVLSDALADPLTVSLAASFTLVDLPEADSAYFADTIEFTAQFADPALISFEENLSISDDFAAPALRTLNSDILLSDTYTPEPNSWLEGMTLTDGLRLINLNYLGKTWATINSYIEVGLYRVGENEDSDEFSLIPKLTINAPNYGDIVVEDWNLLDGSEDWNLLSGAEDWGSGAFGAVDFDTYIKGSLDGYSQFEDQYEELELTDQTQQARYYSCYNNGIYHTVRIEALAERQSFYIKGLDVTLRTAGVLN